PNHRGYSTIKTGQESIELMVTDIQGRLSTVEEKIASLDILEHELTDVEETVTLLSRENASLRSRLDEFEDRSRRDNLIFYGAPDSNSETWAVSESKVRDVIANEMKIIVPPEGIIRAHRLG
ncbi:hypothetical protein HPB47_004010, partial [Ixodes persulcatus]